MKPAMATAIVLLVSCASGGTKIDTFGTPTDVDADTDTDTDSDTDADTDADSDADADTDTDSDTAVPLPDLVPTAIVRDATYYTVTFCNYGGPSAETFIIRLGNVNSGETFDSNALYPFPMPLPGQCTDTGGFTCGLIGDPGCAAAIDVMAGVDPYNSAMESNEANNEMTVPF